MDLLNITEKSKQEYLMKSNKGFTLIELLIVIAIISILAMIAVPAYVGQQTNATRTESYSNLSSLRLLEEQFFSDNSDYTAAAADVAAIQVLLPGFKPGADLHFDYKIVKDEDMDGNAQTPCFHATATGILGSRVAGETYDIDCNNTKNF
jgi:prepilin-type N-terminal cleavage/methylation domain-containing protein